MKTIRYTLSVFTPDRVGILRDVTRTVFELHGNIGAIRQSIVDNYFTLAFTAEFPAGTEAAAIQSALAKALDPAAALAVKPFRGARRPASAPDGARFVVTTRGKDQPGTIFAITDFLVSHAINIEDWSVEEEEGEVVYIAQAVLPEPERFQSVQQAFKEAMAARSLTGLICHENIFRATNEIGPLRDLCSGL